MQTQVFRGLPEPTLRAPSAVAIGNFDGVHRGHRALLDWIAKKAKEQHIIPTVLTFEPHPREFFHRGTLVRISTLRDRYRAILECGIERVIVLPFTQALANLTPQGFAESILRTGLNAKLVAVGENFTFGAGALGSIDTLTLIGQSMGFSVAVRELIVDGTAPVSSSRVREAMHEGDLRKVSELLGRPYTITGRVVHGAALGRRLGFPTLNIDLIPPGSESIPALRGVYAVHVEGIDETRTVYGGVASLGNKPTLANPNPRWLLETHVFDWSGDAYGRMVTVTFMEKLRDEKKFDSLEALKYAIGNDVLEAKKILRNS